MSGNKAPPAPDYSPITNALQSLSGKEQGLGEQQFGWAQNAYNNNLSTANQVVNTDAGVQGEANKFAGDIRNQYENTYQPLENKFAKEAQDYASPDRVASEMGQAGANAAQQMDQSRQNSLRNLESYGISPDATRYAALDANMQAQKGAAIAGAENLARTNTINTGLGLESQAIAQGEVMPSMVAGEQNAGLQAGSQAVNSGLATTASGASTMGTAPQYYSLASGNYGMWGNTLNQQYNNQLSQFKADQNASSGIGSLLGAAAGMGANFLVPGSGVFVGPAVSGMAGGISGGKEGFVKGGAVGDDDGDEVTPFVPHHFYALHGHANGRKLGPNEAVQNLFETGQHIGAFHSPEHANDHIQRQDYGKRYAEGGAIDETQGGHVPVDASPSHGAVTDDISAQLNAGEFVIPKDVAKWKGEEFFQNLIQQSRKKRSTAPAHPTHQDVGPLPQQRQPAVS